MKDVKRMSNDEFIQHVMTIGGQTGPMKQIVIMQAIPKYCEQIVAKKDEMLAQDKEDVKNGKIGIISIPAWIAAAEEILEMFEDKKKE